MFRRVDEEATMRKQRVDNALDEKQIEIEIKACQRENGECMKSTSRNLRQRYGDTPVTHVLNRLRQRRFRGNKYQEKESNEIMNLLSRLTKTEDRIRTQSSDFMSL